MPSKSSMEFLERRRIFTRPVAGGQFAMHGLNSHNRPVATLPELLPPDTPAQRVLTQKDEDRVAYVDNYQI